MDITSTVVGLGFVALATCAGEKIANNLGEGDIAGWIRTAGVGGAGITAVGIAMKLLRMF